MSNDGRANRRAAQSHQVDLRIPQLRAPGRGYLQRLVCGRTPTAGALRPAAGRGNSRVYVYPFGAPATGAGLAYLRRWIPHLLLDQPAAHLVFEDGYVIRTGSAWTAALLKQPSNLERFFDPGRSWIRCGPR